MNTPDAERLAGWLGLTPDEVTDRCRERLTTEAVPRPIETTTVRPPAVAGARPTQVAIEHADIDLDPYYREMQLVNGTRLRR